MRRGRCPLLYALRERSRAIRRRYGDGVYPDPMVNTSVRTRPTSLGAVSGATHPPLGRFPQHYSSRRFQLLTGILEIDCRLLMPKPIARRKTKKAVAKRFKVTATGKVLRGHAGRRHLLVSKNAKRKRQLAKTAVLDKTDEARIKENLPFN